MLGDPRIDQDEFFVRPSRDPDNPPVKVVITRYGGPLPEPKSTIGPNGEVCDVEFVRYGEAPDSPAD
jgi:hypothetical protein